MPRIFVTVDCEVVAFAENPKGIESSFAIPREFFSSLLRRLPALGSNQRPSD